MWLKKRHFNIVLIFIVSTLIIFALSQFLFNFENISAAISQQSFYSSDLSAISSKNYFGRAVSGEIEVGATNDGSGKLKLKLFNLFKIKTKDITVLPPKSVYAGGDIVAMRIRPKGVYITKILKVITDDGEKNVFDNGVLMEGDIILSINGKEINNVLEISSEIAIAETAMKINFIRSGEQKEAEITPLVEANSGKKRLGISVRDDFGGIGTLTFIDEESKNFGALGHSITVNNANIPQVLSGDLLKATVVGFEKGEKGKAGEIKAFENLSESGKLGEIKKNNSKGIYGVIKNEKYLEGLTKMEVGGRFSVKPGKAQILTKIDGENYEKFNIQILKCAKQNKSQTRGLVIKITDKRLLNKTGGIIQGMSGSPIIQNGKIIGAVTHVFLNDAAKGYGIYLDFMLEETALSDE